MEITYKVLGSDGKEYGPVTLDQLTAWLRDNRIGPDSQIMRNDMSHWALAKDFTELQPALPAASATPAPIAPTMPRVASNPEAEARLKSGASWFYWIAGLSVINSISAFLGSDWRFILGLGITQVIDAVGLEMGGAGKIVALVMDLLVFGGFIGLGIFAHKRHTWAFITGMALFGLDALLSLMAQDWLSLGFHAFALFGIFRGFSACRELNQS
ncbi:MAG: GYF domain-containing protein [Verrucomicrobiota bacterium]